MNGAVSICMQIVLKTLNAFFSKPCFRSRWSLYHGENFMAIFTTLSVVIWFSTGILGIFTTLVYVLTMLVVIYDILSMAIIPTLSTSIICYIYYCEFHNAVWWKSPYRYRKFHNIDTQKKKTINTLCGDFYHTIW